ncbi:unnamed protein product [Schistocephalus solidus]|uniref:Fibronectin type-III domain-containing protein n=1 Tax=Schistocephalus solidus TaxID=70667 RepID=A0A183TEG7_SCHSO|nr:unnamed protein product [Schistocephalus solidus]
MVFSSCNQSSVSVLPNFSVPQLSGDYYAPNVSHCAETLRHLQPATRYAIYVERKQLFSHRGEISRIIYFTTKPSSRSSFPVLLPSPIRFAPRLVHLIVVGFYSGVTLVNNPLAPPSHIFANDPKRGPWCRRRNPCLWVICIRVHD